MEDQREIEQALAQSVSLADAYRVMEHFIADYLSRGDTSVSDFLHCYVGLTGLSRTTDPAAIHDFIRAAAQVLDEPPEAS